MSEPQRSSNAYPRALDLSQPIPRIYCRHNDVKDSNVTCGKESPNRCIKCGRVEWRVARKWRERS
jgi:hypothetical protein